MAQLLPWPQANNRAKINQRRSRPSLLQSRILTAPTSALLLICLEPANADPCACRGTFNMNIYTAQYRYNGPDRLDITVKGNQYPGKILAPTWEMVQGYKKQTLNQWDYTIKYFSLITARAWETPAVFRSSLRDIATQRPEITLVCFCPAGEFCHRILAARMLEEMGFGRYVGERQI